MTACASPLGSRGQNYRGHGLSTAIETTREVPRRAIENTTTLLGRIVPPVRLM